MKNKILVLLLILVFLLTACTVGNGNPSDNDGANTENNGNHAPGDGNDDNKDNDNNQDAENNKNDGDGETVKKDPVPGHRTSPIDIKDAFDYVDDGPLPYRIFYPVDYSEEYAYPVLLFLHGAGERGDNNEAQLKNALQNMFNDLESPIYECIVIAPQCPTDEQWVNTPWAEGNYSVDEIAESDNLQKVRQILDTVIEECSVNEERIYVMGLSMGGFGTWDLLMRHGDLFAAGLPVCGGADPAYASAVKDIPIYTVHCLSDGTVPAEGSQAMVQAIIDAGGASIKYEWLQGYGHNVWDYTSNNKEIIYWLFNQ